MKARWFQNVGGIRAVAALRHGEGADATVLFAHDTLDDQAAAQWHAALFQRRRRGDRDRQPGLHVAGPAPVEATSLDVRRPGGRVPRLTVTGGNDVDVTVQDE